MKNYTYETDLFSDLHKDAYGFRPRSHRFYTSSPEEKQIIWDFTIIDLNRELKSQEEAEVQADRDFETNIYKIIDLGAKDRETAIRWMLDAEFDNYDLMYGFDAVSYEFGISNKFRYEVQSVINQLIDKAA